MDALYVFGYGSLTSRASAELTIGRVLGEGDGPHPATLSGFRAEWVVGSDRESHPERRFVRPDGGEFRGCVVVLGLTAAPGAVCPGAVVRVEPAELPPLLVRERNYRLHDVTERVSWRGKPEACVVHAFMPRREALQRLQDAEVAVVRAGYLEVVREGFEALGQKGCFDDLRQRAEAAFPVEELAVVTDGPPSG